MRDISSCASCKYSYLDKENVTLYCRRSPPFPVSVKEEEFIDYKVVVTEVIKGFFPTVEVDWWCGEYNEQLE